MQTAELAPGELRLDFGGIVLSLCPAQADLRFDLGERYRPFTSCAAPEVTLRVHYEAAPLAELPPPLFDSGATWSLHRTPDRLMIRSHTAQIDPYQLLVLDRKLERGDIYHALDARFDQPRCPYPLEYPLDEVLLINLLARGRGVLLHACGVSLDGQGYIFSGVSGAGKSTLATLWEGQPGVTVLSDDRVIVRQHEGQFWLYGTPWHGDARALAPDVVPLRQVFIIEHARQNQAVALKPSDAVARLLVRSFPTFWDAGGMTFTLGFLTALSQSVPCYELGFTPDPGVVDYVRCMISR